MTDMDGVTSYLYDTLNRLTQVNYSALVNGPGAATTNYTLDAVGNRVSDGAASFSYDASDRITNPGYSYDVNGNLLNDGSKSYEYDAANRLTKVISGSVTVNYAYDGWGNLIQESSNGLTSEFVLDENSALPRILGEVRSDGSQQIYAYVPGGFAAQKTVGGTIEYPLLDALGSVRHLTDAAGSVTLSRSYDAFGNLRHAVGNATTRLSYTGEAQDLVLGLIYLRARHYNPVLGRFLQRDTVIGFMARPQSLHRYVYGENKPANLVDPSGHQASCTYVHGSIQCNGNATIGGQTQTVGGVIPSLMDFPFAVAPPSAGVTGPMLAPPPMTMLNTHSTATPSFYAFPMRNYSGRQAGRKGEPRKA